MPTAAAERVGPVPAPAAPSADAPADVAGLQPTIHWEEAQAHANDVLDLPAGGRVTVGFQPRAGDRFQIAGQAPRALPAGRASGRDLRQAALDEAAGRPVAAPAEPTPVEPTPTAEPTSPAEPTPAPTPVATSTPVDQPVIDPADSIRAAPASFSDGPIADSSPLEPTAAVTPYGLTREVFGFLPYWELSDSSTTLDYAKISTIAYFGVGAAANGSLERTNADGSTTVGWSGWTSSKLTSVINAAHQNRTRVVLTVQSFAWSSGRPRSRRRSSGARRPATTWPARSPPAVRDRGADGVNLDFEPLASGYEDEFLHLLRRIRIELDAMAAGYQITFDTTGYIGNYPLEDATAPGAADAIFIMGYDYRTAGSSPVGSIAPLVRSGYDITDTLDAYTARVPASKLILGVPYYGRAWSTDTDKRPRRRTSAARSTARRPRSSTRPGSASSSSTASAPTRRRASPGPPTAARTARRPTAA